MRVKLVLLILLFLATNCFASGELKVTIETDKTQYKMGDELILKYTIANIGSRDVEVERCYGDYLRLSITTADNIPLQNTAFCTYGKELPEFRLIKSGDTFRRELRYNFKSNRFSTYCEGYEIGGIDKIKIKGSVFCNSGELVCKGEKLCTSDLVPYPEIETKLSIVESEPVIIIIEKLE